MSTTFSLVNQVVKGIAMLKKKPSASNLTTVKAILDICDRLHKGGHVKGYKSTDIPSDEKYEELKQLYESLTEPEENAIQEHQLTITDEDKQLVVQMDIDGKLAQQKQRYQRKGQKHEAYIGIYAKLDRSEHQPILIMDGIELPKSIPTIPNDCILMPKFDGCTIAIAFNDKTITVAHTRGVDSTTGDRKISYVTDKMNLLLDPVDAFDLLRATS